jgi:hypothetical protein
MKSLRKYKLKLFLICLLTSIMLFIGCGRQQAHDEGCPSGSYVANATDKIIGPADGTLTINSNFGYAFQGGPIPFSPLTYTVLDDKDEPRNNICITFYTDGFWHSDNTYATVVTGSGTLNQIVAVTDDSGRAILYWSSAFLPPANSAILGIPVSVPPTYTAGTDQTGDSFVNAYSGVLEDLFKVTWTVKGEPAQ